MRKIFILVIVFLFIGICPVIARDAIYLQNWDMIVGIVLEVTPTDIKYRGFQKLGRYSVDLGGLIRSIPIKNVRYIRFENGSYDFFSNERSIIPYTRYEYDIAVGVNQSAFSENRSNKRSATKNDENQNNPQGQSRESKQSRETVSDPQLGEPNLLQLALNRLPAVPIAGNSLKFEFGGENWIAKVDGQNFMAGSCILEETDNGYILTLTATNVWTGAVEKVIDLLQKIGVPLGPATGPLKTAAKFAGRIAKWIPLRGSDIILEYKVGPPASFQLYSNK